MSATVKRSIIFLISSIILDFAALYALQLFYTPTNPNDVQLIFIYTFIVLPILSIIFGVLCQLFIQKLWVSPIIIAISTIITVPALVIYIPQYALVAFISSFVTYAVIRMKKVRQEQKDKNQSLKE